MFIGQYGNKIKPSLNIIDLGFEERSKTCKISLVGKKKNVIQTKGSLEVVYFC